MVRPPGLPVQVKGLPRCRPLSASLASGPQPGQLSPNTPRTPGDVLRHFPDEARRKDCHVPQKRPGRRCRGSPRTGLRDHSGNPVHRRPPAHRRRHLRRPARRRLPGDDGRHTRRGDTRGRPERFRDRPRTRPGPRRAPGGQGRADRRRRHQTRALRPHLQRHGRDRRRPGRPSGRERQDHRFGPGAPGRHRGRPHNAEADGRRSLGQGREARQAREEGEGRQQGQHPGGVRGRQDTRPRLPLDGDR